MDDVSGGVRSSWATIRETSQKKTACIFRISLNLIQYFSHFIENEVEAFQIWNFSRKKAYSGNLWWNDNFSKKYFKRNKLNET